MSYYLSRLHSAFVARELAPAGARSGPKPAGAECQANRVLAVGAATQPSGSKLPRHKKPAPSASLFPIRLGDMQAMQPLVRRPLRLAPALQQ
ncbi:hypothetical protein DZG01_03820 [Pseudomonas fluorescens]|nr:hypothetical protein DZG01_03820 [Pseudomonas fluorescens]